MTQIIPWIRSGLSTTIANAAVRGRTTDLRAVTTVGLDATANHGADSQAATTQSIELYGPGDVVALADNQVRTVYPQPGTPDAEWNFFAYLELHEADLPWRYSPAGPDGDDIAPPWLALIVVEDGVEATFATNARGSTITVESAASLPPPDDLWAWAHAFGDGDPVARPDLFRARLLCPRRLRPDAGWRACLVPAFRTGRNVGLGLPIGTDAGPAWAANETDVELPVYHSWTFRTGVNDGTFYSLATKLMPRELTADVGVRTLELHDPGAPLPSIPEASTDFVGAMFSPAYRPQPDRTGVLAEFAASYVEQLTPDDTGTRGGAASTKEPSRTERYDALLHDPVVALPLYGSSQQHGEALPDDAGHWYRQLSTDPVHRSVAALGAEVVRNDQESLMAAAWEHAASLAQINEALQRARLAAETAAQRKQKFEALRPTHKAQVIGPVIAALGSGNALFGADLDVAEVPRAVLGGSFRRITRAGGPVQRATTVQPTTAGVAAPIDRFVGGVLTRGVAAYRQPTATVAPFGVDIGMRAVTQVAPAGTFELGALEHRRPLAGLTDRPVDIQPGSLDIAWATATSSVTVTRTRLDAVLADPAQIDRVQPGSAPVTTITAAIGSPKRRGSRRPSAQRSTSRFRPSGELTAVPSGSVQFDFSQGTRTITVAEIRAQIIAQPFQLVTERPGDMVQQGVVATALPLLTADVAALMTRAIDPVQGIRDWTNSRIRSADSAEGPAADVAPTGAPIPTALIARPKFELPMYERLRELSVEYIVPGIGMVPKNTVGALSINNAFVESFLVGANHELSREFRWREYPAPLHLTWFDQFWDVAAGGPADIAPIGKWKPTALGEHATGGDRLVVLVKGELIERFPDVSIYMIQASLLPNGTRWSRR